MFQSISVAAKYIMKKFGGAYAKCCHQYFISSRLGKIKQEITLIHDRNINCTQDLVSHYNSPIYIRVIGPAIHLMRLKKIKVAVQLLYWGSYLSFSYFHGSGCLSENKCKLREHTASPKQHHTLSKAKLTIQSFLSSRSWRATTPCVSKLLTL